MDEYKNYIADLAESKSSDIFYNSSPDHAAIVMGTIFNNSKSGLRIFAGNMCSEVSTNDYYLDNLSKYLEQGGSVKVLLNDHKENFFQTKVFELLSFHSFINPASVSVKTYSGKVKLTKNDSEVHFTIGSSNSDDTVQMYRLEDDIVNYIAYGSFNDSITSTILKTIFDKIDSGDKVTQILPQ